jgi:hypothetical protein
MKQINISIYLLSIFNLNNENVEFTEFREWLAENCFYFSGYRVKSYTRIQIVYSVKKFFPE